jgi:hypothetical protein
VKITVPCCCPLASCVPDCTLREACFMCIPVRASLWITVQNLTSLHHSVQCVCHGQYMLVAWMCLFFLHCSVISLQTRLLGCFRSGYQLLYSLIHLSISVTRTALKMHIGTLHITNTSNLCPCCHYFAVRSNVSHKRTLCELCVVTPPQEYTKDD